jgi:hypothetical protein
LINKCKVKCQTNSITLDKTSFIGAIFFRLTTKFLNFNVPLIDWIFTICHFFRPCKSILIEVWQWTMWNASRSSPSHQTLNSFLCVLKDLDVALKSGREWREKKLRRAQPNWPLPAATVQKARAAGVLIELQNAAADAKRTSAGMNEWMRLLLLLALAKVGRTLLLLHAEHRAACTVSRRGRMNV